MVRKFPAKLTTARGSNAANALVKYVPGVYVPPVYTPPVVVVPPVTSGTNLFSDSFGTFEGTDLTLYTSGPAQGTGAVASFDTTWFASGTKSLRITAASGATYNAGLVWPLPAPTPGQFIRSVGTVHRGVGSTKAQVSIDFFNSSGAYISGVTLVTLPSSNNTTLAFDQTATVPANTVSAQITARFSTNPPVTGDYWNIDNFQSSVVTTNPNDGLPGGTFAPRATAGTYSISGTKLMKDGVQFKVIGANMGVNAGIGGNYTSDESVSAHTAEAIQWGWNIVRMHVYVSTTTSWIAAYTQTRAFAEIFAATDKYLAAGFVVILAVMDQTSGLQAENETAKQDFELFFGQAATRYVNESRVWFNVNEPSNVYNVATFNALNKRMYDAVRNTGNTSIYVADILTNAQDGVYTTQTRAWDPILGPAFLAGTDQGGVARTNVLFALHDYGGQAQNSDSQAAFNSIYNTWAQKMHDAGLAHFVGETGWKQNGTDQGGTTGDFNRNHNGFYAALQMLYSNGICVWDATFDQFTLKIEMQTQYHGQPFWYQGAGTGLSQMGIDYWNFGHAYTAPSWT